MELEITREVAEKVLKVVDAGLVSGMGKPVPGQMCVEAAVCYALGLPHSDDPKCVAPILRSLKIRLNDSSWSSDKARASGLRRLALIQLGSKDNLDDKEFARRLVDLAIGKQVPIALRAAASVHKDSNHKAALLAAADRCEKERNKEAALNARDISRAARDNADASAYAYASASASANWLKQRDKVKSAFAEDVVQILVEMGVPGAQWLDLAPYEAIAA